jgi:hypothetical protein
MGLHLSEIISIIFVLGLFLLPQIFYLLTLQNTLKLISPENRSMEPGHVWLALIPIFGLFWNFHIIGNMATSIQTECRKRNIPCDNDPGYALGRAYCILICCSIIPWLGSLAAIAGLVCWIIYWVKISGYKAELEATR